MKYTTLLKAVLLGFAVIVTGPTGVSAETIQVMRGAPSSSLKVPMNRAVVVESDTPFAELSIANPGIADISTLSERTIYVLGKAPGRTTLTLLGADGRLITNVDVQVTPDVAEFKERLQQIIPGERIEVRTANDGIVLSGTVSSIARLDRALDLAERYAPGKVSNLMSVGGTQQVMLEVRFAEVQRSVSKRLNGGVRIDTTGSDGLLTSGGGSGGLASAGGVIGSGFTLDSEAIGGLGISFDIGDVELEVLLEALEGKGLVRTLAEPNLTALSGQEANFLAGGEFPVPVVDDNDVSIEYKPFGVELNFVPRVVDGDQINLTLTAAVSSLDRANGIVIEDVPIAAFSRRETSTVVELRDGESFAIAGLLQDDFQDFNNQVPWLGDIPVLGALFRSADYQRQQSELVILITAHLVSPIRGEALALPTDRVTPPTEAELFLFGRTASTRRPTTGGASEVARQDFGGSYGYVME